jgi:DNA modification methylase
VRPPKFQVVQGDALATLRSFPERSVQCVVTSPPYWGLRSYLPKDHPLKSHEIGTERTPQEYVEKIVAVFREVRRVLRDDGVCWLNLGDCYARLVGIDLFPENAEMARARIANPDYARDVRTEKRIAAAPPTGQLPLFGKAP